MPRSQVTDLLNEEISSDQDVLEQFVGFFVFSQFEISVIEFCSGKMDHPLARKRKKNYQKHRVERRSTLFRTSPIILATLGRPADIAR